MDVGQIIESASRDKLFGLKVPGNYRASRSDEPSKLLDGGHKLRVPSSGRSANMVAIATLPTADMLRSNLAFSDHIGDRLIAVPGRYQALPFPEITAQCFSEVKPREALLRKVLFFGRLKLRGLIERTNMEVCLRRPGEAFTSQGRSASSTKAAAPRWPGRRIELGYLAFGNAISFQVIKREDSGRRSGMPSTTITMTPIYTALGSPVVTKRTAPKRQPPSSRLVVLLMISSSCVRQLTCTGEKLPKQIE